MGRILAIDYGQKRVGVAVTDPLKMIANGLDTVHSKDIFAFLSDYTSRENVERIVVGYPVTLRNKASQALEFVNPFLKKLIKTFPDIIVDAYDERYTSKMASQTILLTGTKKKDRQNKALTDKVSAIILLQSYMEYLDFKQSID